MIGLVFVNRLTQEQKLSLFDLAVRLAGADREIDDEEQDYLKVFSETYEIPYALDRPEQSLDDLVRPFQTHEAKVILLQELIMLSYKDGHFGKEEQEQVFVIAQKLGLNDSDLILSIERWVRQGFDWQYEGEQLLEE